MSDDRGMSAFATADPSIALKSRLVLAGACFGFVGVALGAFGAHALSSWLAPDLLEVFETAVRYQLVHAVALIALAGVVDWNAQVIARAGGLFALGIVLFAGSLYGLVFSGIGLLGAITPFGGLCFLAGWAILAWAAWETRSAGSA